MLYRWLRTAPFLTLAVVAPCHAGVHDQSPRAANLTLPAAGPLSSASASAATFTQLSRPETALPPPSPALSSSALLSTPAPTTPEHEYLSLAVAALAALTFVGRRHRRAMPTSARITEAA